MKIPAGSDHKSRRDPAYKTKAGIKEALGALKPTRDLWKPTTLGPDVSRADQVTSAAAQIILGPIVKA